jgi:cell division protein FtsZ
MLHELPPIPGFEPIALNDKPHPSMIGIGRRLFVSKEGLRGIAETDKRARRDLHTEVERTISREIEGSDVVFIISGLGGYTGTWASPIVASVARHCKAVAVSLVSLPFTVEGIARRGVASEGLGVLQDHSDVVITYSNDELLKLAPNIPLLQAFKAVGRLVSKPIVSLASVLTRGDLPHLKSVLRGVAEMRIGMGEGSGDHRNFLGVEDAFTSPWFDFDLGGAKEAMLFLTSQYVDPDDVDEILHEISLRAPNANITWGSVEEDVGEKMRVSVLLGF